MRSLCEFFCVVLVISGLCAVAIYTITELRKENESLYRAILLECIKDPPRTVQ